MSSVYDFHEEDEIENDDETVEADVTGERSDSCYNYTKDLPSFSTWSLTLSGQGKICINLDGIDIDTYVKVKYPDINYKFGAVGECGLSSDETCIKVLGMKLDDYDSALQEHRKENEKLNEALKLARQSPRIHEYFSEQEIQTLPFSVEGMTVEVISPKAIGLVEHNAGAIYMGLLERQDMIYYKKPLGKLEKGNFKFQFADGLETTLNMKDIQKINEIYLITTFELEVVNNQISVTEKEHEQIKEAIAIYIKS